MNLITNTAFTSFVCMSNANKKSPCKTIKKANNTIAIGEK